MYTPIDSVDYFERAGTTIYRFLEMLCRAVFFGQILSKPEDNSPTQTYNMPDIQHLR